MFKVNPCGSFEFSGTFLNPSLYSSLPLPSDLRCVYPVIPEDWSSEDYPRMSLEGRHLPGPVGREARPLGERGRHGTAEKEDDQRDGSRGDVENYKKWG